MIYFLKETCTFVPDINKQALIFHREWPYHRHISFTGFTIIILSPFPMKDKTDKPVISYYLGNNYIII
jgi:hypothetical protein